MSILDAIKSALAGEKQVSNKDRAKERLHVLLIRDRAGSSSPDFLPQLRLDIVEVLKKYYLQIQPDDVAIKCEDLDGPQIIEFQISIDVEPNK